MSSTDKFAHGIFSTAKMQMQHSSRTDSSVNRVWCSLTIEPRLAPIFLHSVHGDSLYLYSILYTYIYKRVHMRLLVLRLSFRFSFDFFLLLFDSFSLLEVKNDRIRVRRSCFVRLCSMQHNNRSRYSRCRCRCRRRQTKGNTEHFVCMHVGQFLTASQASAYACPRISLNTVWAHIVL